ncbi:MAG: transposase, partial [Bryobacteraceae bacterium]
LAALGHERLKCTSAQLQDALSGSVQPLHRQLLGLFLERLELLDAHIGKINLSIAEGLRAHQEAVLRLAEVPGFGPDSAQQVIAEVGPRVLAFDSAVQLASWVGVCPGRAESAGQNHSAHSAKGNPYLRRLLTQAAQAAVHKKGSRLQSVFHRLVPRLGYRKAIWAIAHRLCRLVWKILHDQVRFVESGQIENPQNQKRRVQKMLQALKKLGYSVQLTPLPLPGVTS